MTVEAAQSVRIAVGASQSHQSLATQLSDMGLDVDVVASAQALYDVEPSVAVLDPELLGDLALNQLRAKLPRTVFIAADALSREAELPLPEAVDAQIRVVKTACELSVSRQQAALYRDLASSSEEDVKRLTNFGVALSAESDLD